MPKPMYLGGEDQPVEESSHDTLIDTMSSCNEDSAIERALGPREGPVEEASSSDGVPGLFDDREIPEPHELP